LRNVNEAEGEGSGANESSVTELSANKGTLGDPTKKHRNSKKQPTNMVNSTHSINNAMLKDKDDASAVKLRQRKTIDELRANESSLNLTKTINHSNGYFKREFEGNASNQKHPFGDNQTQINSGANKVSFQQLSVPQPSETLLRPTFGALNNNKTISIANINAHASDAFNMRKANCSRFSPSSHQRLSSVDHRTLKFNHIPKNANVITINSKSSVYNGSANPLPPTAEKQTHLLSHQNPLATLAEEPYLRGAPSQQCKLVRTNHPQYCSISNDGSEFNKGSKVGQCRIGNLHNGNVNDKCGVQSPKVESAATHSNKVFNNIIYLRPPNRP
jgi:hypothetical protein